MNKTLRYVLGVLAALVLLAVSFSSGFVTGRYLPNSLPLDQLPAPLMETAPSTPSPEQMGATPTDLQTLFVPFWEAWNIVHEQYVDQPVDDVELMRGAIRGMLESLGDAHTSYMDPQQFKDANAELAGEYEGIGAWVDITGEYLTIVSPMPDSPAERAGLKPGDQVIAVDGEDVTGMDGELVRRRILGPAGTTVRLTIRREGVEEPLEFEVTRERIIIHAVQGEMLDNGIAYVQIFTFGDKTTPELRDTLKDLLSQNPRGLILDLRNNGGGYLVTAIEVASQFIPDGVIMYEQYGDGSRQSYTAQPGGLATEIPMVVLINEGTASASEIVAGAIQDRERGLLVGTTSFGKGSVQNWVPLSNDQGAVRVTVAKWLTPNGRTIHEVGLTPDVVVEMPEDVEAGNDPQLDKAIEVLLEIIGEQ